MLIDMNKCSKAIVISGSNAANNQNRYEAEVSLSAGGRDAPGSGTLSSGLFRRKHYQQTGSGENKEIQN